jgi:hypothetical protein
MLGCGPVRASRHNEDGAGYTVNNNSETGTGNTGYNLGLRHTF